MCEDLERGAPASGPAAPWPLTPARLLARFRSLPLAASSPSSLSSFVLCCPFSQKMAISVLGDTRREEQVGDLNGDFQGQGQGPALTQGLQCARWAALGRARLNLEGSKGSHALPHPSHQALRPPAPLPLHAGCSLLCGVVKCLHHTEPGCGSRPS